jgi:C1 domain
VHENCTTYPQIVSFFAHPWDKLLLADHSALTHCGSKCCDICSEPLNGFYYKCTPCGFNLHPHCSKSSRIVQTKFHPNPMTLVPTTGNCSACKQNLTVWSYKCGMCCVKLHYKCLFTFSSINECDSICRCGAKASKQGLVAKTRSAEQLRLAQEDGGKCLCCS